MNLEFSNKRVLIPSSSKGIDRARARTFLAEHARVTLVSRVAANLLAAQSTLLNDASGAVVNIIAADLRDAAYAERRMNAVEPAFGAVNVLVNSAGAAKRTPADEFSVAAWHDATQAKFFTYINVITPPIKRSGERTHCAVVSIIGSGCKGVTVTHLTGGAAYAGKGERVNAVNPGLTLTERLHKGMQADARQQGISIEEALTRTKATRPLGRIPERSAIADADAVAYLASNRAGYITGAVVSM